MVLLWATILLRYISFFLVFSFFLVSIKMKMRNNCSAGNEFPLTGRFNVSAIQSVEEEIADGLLSDEELFGSRAVYREALEILASKGSFESEKVALFGGKSISIFKTHPSIKNPWTDVSIRSIENVNYDIVDLSHPMQGNRTDGNHHEAAVLVRLAKL